MRSESLLVGVTNALLPFIVWNFWKQERYLAFIVTLACLSTSCLEYVASNKPHVFGEYNYAISTLAYVGDFVLILFAFHLYYYQLESETEIYPDDWVYPV